MVADVVAVVVVVVAIVVVAATDVAAADVVDADADAAVDVDFPAPPPKSTTAESGSTHWLPVSNADVAICVAATTTAGDSDRSSSSALTS